MSKNKKDELGERKMRRNTRNDVEADDDSDEQSHYDDEAVPIRLRRKSFYTKSYNPEEDLDETEIKLFPKTDEVKTKLESSIKDNLLFRSLEPEQLSVLIDAMEELNVNKETELIREGDDNHGFYVIDNGEYEIRTVSSGIESVKRVQNGTFGELTLLHNQNSRSTVTAKTNGKLYSLNRNDFRKIVTKTTHELRKNLEELINKVPMLKDLTEFDKLKVADVLELINFSDGDVIFKEGESSDGVYLVVRGSVKIVEKNDTGNRETIVGSGEHFGELPASKPSGACASAVALGPTKVAFLKAEAFERLMGPCLKVLKKNPSHSRKPAPNL